MSHIQERSSKYFKSCTILLYCLYWKYSGNNLTDSTASFLRAWPALPKDLESFTSHFHEQNLKLRYSCYFSCYILMEINPSKWNAYFKQSRAENVYVTGDPFPLISTLGASGHIAYIEHTCRRVTYLIEVFVEECLYILPFNRLI